MTVWNKLFKFLKKNGCFLRNLAQFINYLLKIHHTFKDKKRREKERMRKRGKREERERE